ncbi:hypothetical protein HNQ96_003905 [Aminobacter lissarensis]|uniref:Uncharacterized protein n=1 Tax=Aminobacter carboxidus TaxID=376165 RepID=A0A8E2BCW1_9HYPH|nr:hypothetical protein [Aminobacter lissarensis]
MPGMLNEIQRHPGMRGYIIACFDDTGLDAARCIADAPVIGIGEAAFHMAALLAHKMARKRSCSDAPAWRIWQQHFRAVSACRFSMASHARSSLPKGLRPWD